MRFRDRPRSVRQFWCVLWNDPAVLLLLNRLFSWAWRWLPGGVLLGLLIQLHFSYFLLLPCHVALSSSERDPSDDNAGTNAPKPRPRESDARASAKLVATGGHVSRAELLVLILSVGMFAYMLWSGSSFRWSIFEERAGSPVAIPNEPYPATTSRFISKASIASTISPRTSTEGSRHTLAVVPPMFILAGFGFAGVVSIVGPAKRWLGTCLILPLLITLGVWAANSATIEKISRSEVDYRSRDAIARDIAVHLGASPEVYARRTYWWWVGWSIDPEIYAETYQRSVIPPAVQQSPLTSDQCILVTSARRRADARGGCARCCRL